MYRGENVVHHILIACGETSHQAESVCTISANASEDVQAVATIEGRSVLGEHLLQSISPVQRRVGYEHEDAGACASATAWDPEACASATAARVCAALARSSRPKLLPARGGRLG